MGTLVKSVAYGCLLLLFVQFYFIHTWIWLCFVYGGVRSSKNWNSMTISNNVKWKAKKKNAHTHTTQTLSSVSDEKTRIIKYTYMVCIGFTDISAYFIWILNQSTIPALQHNGSSAIRMWAQHYYLAFPINAAVKGIHSISICRTYYPLMYLLAGECSVQTAPICFKLQMILQNLFDSFFFFWNFFYALWHRQIVQIFKFLDH